LERKPRVVPLAMTTVAVPKASLSPTITSPPLIATLAGVSAPSSVTVPELKLAWPTSVKAYL